VLDCHFHVDRIADEPFWYASLITSSIISSLRHLPLRKNHKVGFRFLATERNIFPPVPSNRRSNLCSLMFGIHARPTTRLHIASKYEMAISMVPLVNSSPRHFDYPFGRGVGHLNLAHPVCKREQFMNKKWNFMKHNEILQMKIRDYVQLLKNSVNIFVE